MNLLRYSITNGNVKLQWESTPGAEKYKIYKKIKESDSDYILLNETDKISYIDIIADESILYAPQIKMKSERDYGLIKFYFLDNEKNRKTFEYYIEYLDVDDNIISSSEKVTVEINNEIKDFNYLVKYNDSPITSSDIFLPAEEQCATITNIQDGKYIIYCYSKYKDRKSEISSLRFVIDNTIFEENLNCDIPNGIKSNNRYRGPQESKKEDAFINIAINNLKKLKDRFKFLESYQKELYDKVEVNNILTGLKIEEIKISIDDKREELKYEKRNS